jgi:ubiquinone/menaquinone biosynthesis C-methylase UbiE
MKVRQPAQTSDALPGRPADANDLRRRSYAEEAPGYDKEMDLFESVVLGREHRSWACSQARGEVLEVAIGTGLNLPHYPAEVRLTGLDLTAEMLAIASARARSMGRAIHLLEGDAQALPFSDGSFDTVLSTYAMCSVPDVSRVVSETKRVMKPGGRLVLVDHVGSTVKPIFWLQRLIDVFESRKGEYMTRRPLKDVRAAGFQIHTRNRLRLGIVERLVALKTGD